MFFVVVVRLRLCCGASRRRGWGRLELLPVCVFLPLCGILVVLHCLEVCKKRGVSSQKRTRHSRCQIGKTRGMHSRDLYAILHARVGSKGGCACSKYICMRVAGSRREKIPAEAHETFKESSSRSAANQPSLPSPYTCTQRAHDTSHNPNPTRTNTPARTNTLTRVKTQGRTSGTRARCYGTRAPPPPPPPLPATTTPLRRKSKMPQER